MPGPDPRTGIAPPIRVLELSVRSALPILASVALCLVPAPLASQTVGERLEEFRLRVDRIADVASLDALEVAVAAQGEDDPEAAIRIGLVALRRYELTLSRVAHKRALDTFEEAARRHARFAWPHYALGMAHARGPEVWIPESRGYRQRMVHVLSLAERRGRRALLRAVELDLGLAAAALELTSLAMASRQEATLEAARDALLKVTGREASEPEVWVALADVEAALGNLEASLAATDSALARDRRDATAFHAMADALLRQPGQEEVGLDAYFVGVGYLTPDAAVRYYEDVLPILNEDEIAEWKSASLESRREWLRRFWELKAAVAGVRVSERMAAHYRRLEVAHRSYRRLGTRGAPPENAFLLEAKRRQLPFDDRGLILIRHGAPDERVRTPGANLPPNESWAYLRVDALPQTFDFLKGRSRPDLTLGRVLTCKPEYSPAARPEDRINVDWTGDDDIRQFMRYFEDRARFDGRYQRFAMRCANAISRLSMAGTGDSTTSPGDSLSRVMEAYAELGALQMRSLELDAQRRLSTENALEHDTYLPAFTEDLPFVHRFYAFRGPDTGSEITAAFLFPAERFEPRTFDGDLVYSLDVSYIIADSVAGSVRRADTVFHFRAPRRLEAGQFIRADLSVSAAPSASAFYRVAARDAASPQHGRIIGGPITVPDLSPRTLQLSDVVLAEEGGGPWRRGGVGLALRPTHRFRVGEPLVLFYEIYDLPTDAPYRTEITVEPEGGGAVWSLLRRFLGIQVPSALSLRFEGVAGSPVGPGLQELRSVAGSLLPGDYAVRVTVTNLEWLDSATAETRLTVVQ